MSAGWVFPGWVSWSRWFKDNYGVYPDERYPSILVKLARMSKSVRDKIIMPELMKMESYDDLFHKNLLVCEKFLFGANVLDGIIKEGGN
jgi:hypothetical protein